MVSTLNLQEKYNKVRKSFCFYLDIQEPELSRSISRRLQDMGLREEVFLTPRVTHVVGSRAALSAGGAGGSGRGAARCARREGRARADAMLERLRPEPQPAPPQPQAYVHLTVHKAISLLDKLYDTFFKAPRKSHVRLFSKHFIKIEFLDKLCRPVYKEFDEWPQISLEPDPPKERKEKKESLENLTNTFKNNTAGQKMTRKSRPRIKEREEKETKGGYCEMCNTDYVDAALHRRSPHHLAFVRDHTNFIALDSLISSGADVSTFLDKATPVNGERRSLRKLCNGDAESKNKCTKRSQSSESAVNGNQSPKRNGGLDDERKHNTRCSKRSSESQMSEYRQYYKVVGVSTKLRSSGGFAAKRKESPTCNGTKPLVVKFRKIRRSELSVLSDEAEQFMFPKRANSTSTSSSSDEDDSGRNDSKELVTRTKRKTPPQPAPAIDRQRLARPVALKEESSEDDSWPEDHRKRKKRAPVTMKRGRRLQYKTHVVGPPPKPPEPEQPPTTAQCPEQPEAEVNPLREEPTEKCMKWEDGKLKYTPAVEKLEFAFESVPHSEPWFETFKRQDQDKVLTKNVPQYFALYSKSPKLPYEIGPLPPLKPNCCPLSDFVKREEKAGPSRSYGTRGMKKQKIKKRTVALMALEHPRKSPREHASTLAILGSAGLLHRRKHAEDAKSTASEETSVSDTHSNAKLEPMVTETQEASERMQQFLSEVFDDAAEYDVSDEFMEVGTTVTTSTNIPDLSSLVSECENCDIIRNEIKLNSNQLRTKKGKFKKKNKTGWPNKRKQVRKASRNSSMETEKAESLDRSSIEPLDDESTQDTVTEEDRNISETERDDTVIENKCKSDDDSKARCAKKAPEKLNESPPCDRTGVHITQQEDKLGSDTSPVKMDLKVVLEDKIRQKTPKAEEKECKRSSRSSASETEDKDKCSKKKRPPLAIGDWLQPIVRVSRMEPNSARRLRSAGRPRGNRFR